jgi:hypothetical protein
MPAGRWGSDDEWWDGEHLDPLFTPDDDLEHELALAAALDRSRTDLSPDAETSERMRADFFAALEKEWGAPEESATERTTRIEPVPADAFDQTTDLTAALRPEGPEGATRSGSSGERTVAATSGAAGTGSRRSKRGPRHVLTADHPDNPGRAGGSRGPGGRRPSLRKRVALVGGAAALALVALTGGTAMMSGDALPGDTLYAVKLATESTGTAFTFGDAAKAQRHLDLAATRLDEVRRLQQAGRTPSADTYETALTAFDDAASEGSRMLLAGAQPPTDTGLDDLDAWAQKQARAIEALRASGDVPGADRSARLLERMSDRAAALQARMGCSEVSDGVDDLGPIPATSPCVPVASNAGRGDGAVDARVPNGSPQSASTSPAAPSDSTGPQPSGDPAADENGVLSDVLPGTGEAGATSTTPSGSARSSSTERSSSDAPGGGSGGGGGLLPPIQVPPLLPGLGPITIG